MNFILTGGGTGGHVYPALAIAEALKQHFKDARFLYLGVRGRAEENIVPQLGYKIKFVASEGLAGRKPGLRFLLPALKMLIGLCQALVIHLQFRPAAVIGTGGYASVPAVLAAVILRRCGLAKVRIFIHEQNYAPGRWNRLISRWADRVWISFLESERYFPLSRVEFTGYPVRRQFAPRDRLEARKELGLPAEAKVLLVFGGSQGARSINRAIVDALPALLADPLVEVFHGTGNLKAPNYSAVKDTAARVAELKLDLEQLARYHPRDFITEIQVYYAAADLLVCRAGAGTLNEICRCGKPALIIPKSSLAGEHQAVNALAMARAGVCEVILERPVADGEGGAGAFIDGAQLAARIQALLADRETLERMSRAALSVNGAADMEVFVRSVGDELQGIRLGPRRIKAAPDGWQSDEAVKLAGLSPAGVLAYVQKNVGRLDPEALEKYPSIQLLRYFADIFLTDRRWPVRNIGVKLAGLTLHRERRDLLISIAGDRVPAPLYKRLLGKDFSQVGFIRRNALFSLGQLGVWDEALSGLVFSALSEDPYYEVRVQAALLLIHFRDKCGPSAALVRALEANLAHRSLEVRWTCLEALGVVAPDAGFLERMRRFNFHPNWRIRQALLKAAVHLLERGVISAGDPGLKSLEDLIPTCTDFIPTFPLKNSLNRIHRLRGGDANPAGSTQ